VRCIPEAASCLENVPRDVPAASTTTLKGDYDDSVWDHLAGTKSAPFEAGEHRQIAVKVIDDRGNELLVVKPLS